MANNQVRLSAPTVPRMVLLGALAGGTTGALRDLRNALLHSNDIHPF